MPSAVSRSSSTDFTSEPSCSLLARTLRLLVAIEVAGDALGGAVEEIGEGPEQVVEVGFEPGVAEHAGEGLEDPGKAGADHRLVGQRPRVRLVLMRTVAVHLQFEDDAVGRRGGVDRARRRRRREGRRSWRVSVGCGRAYRGLTAHPGRAPGRGRTEGRSEAEDGAAVAAVTAGVAGVASQAGRGRGLCRRTTAMPAAFPPTAQRLARPPARPLIPAADRRRASSGTS